MKGREGRRGRERIQEGDNSHCRERHPTAQSPRGSQRGPPTHGGRPPPWSPLPLWCDLLPQPMARGLPRILAPSLEPEGGGACAARRALATCWLGKTVGGLPGVGGQSTVCHKTFSMSAGQPKRDKCSETRPRMIMSPPMPGALWRSEVKFPHSHWPSQTPCASVPRAHGLRPLHPSSISPGPCDSLLLTSCGSSGPSRPSPHS